MASPGFAALLLAGICLFEFIVLLFSAARKAFWYDELVVVHLVSLRHLSRIFDALWAGCDPMPVAFYSIAELASRLPGDPHVTLRLPSILGYLLALTGIYIFVGKRLPPLAGITAVLLLTLSPFRAYAIEARPYALLIGLLTLAAVCWQRDGDQRFMTPLFALFLALAVSIHYLAVFTIACFGLAELAWSVQSRRIRWQIWAGCVFAALPFLLALPLVLHYTSLYAKNFWARPTWGLTVSTYSFYAGLETNLAVVFVAFFAAVVGMLLLRISGKSGHLSPPRDFPIPEVVLMGAFLGYPAFLVLFSKIMSSAFTPRYGWPGIIGFVLAFSYLFRNVWFKTASVQLLAAFLFAFAIQTRQDLLPLRGGNSRPPDETLLQLANVTRSEPDLPVVIASGKMYLEAHYYAPPALRDRIVEVVDSGEALRVLGTDSVDRTNRLLIQFFPLQIVDRARFEPVHQRFYLQTGGGFDWLTTYLVERQYHLRLLTSSARAPLYLVEK